MRSFNRSCHMTLDAPHLQDNPHRNRDETVVVAKAKFKNTTTKDAVRETPVTAVRDLYHTRFWIEARDWFLRRDMAILRSNLLHRLLHRRLHTCTPQCSANSAIRSALKKCRALNPAREKCCCKCWRAACVTPICIWQAATGPPSQSSSRSR